MSCITIFLQINPLLPVGVHKAEWIWHWSDIYCALQVHDGWLPSLHVLLWDSHRGSEPQREISPHDIICALWSLHMDFHIWTNNRCIPLTGVNTKTWVRFLQSRKSYWLHFSRSLPCRCLLWGKLATSVVQQKGIHHVEKIHSLAMAILRNRHRAELQVSAPYVIDNYNLWKGYWYLWGLW